MNFFSSDSWLRIITQWLASMGCYAGYDIIDSDKKEGALKAAGESRWAIMRDYALPAACSRMVFYTHVRGSTVYRLWVPSYSVKKALQHPFKAQLPVAFITENAGSFCTWLSRSTFSGIKSAFLLVLGASNLDQYYRQWGDNCGCPIMAVSTWSLSFLWPTKSMCTTFQLGSSIQMILVKWTP